MKHEIQYEIQYSKKKELYQQPNEFDHSHKPNANESNKNFYNSMRNENSFNPINGEEFKGKGRKEQYARRQFGNREKRHFSPLFQLVFPSEQIIHENQNEIYFLNQKLSDLIKNKNKVTYFIFNFYYFKIENEIVNLPKKLNSLEQIERKRSLEVEILINEKDINFAKMRLREIRALK